MELLELRNLKHSYEPYEVWTDQEDVEYEEDEFVTEYSAGNKFIDKLNNNRIHYTFYGVCNKEDVPDDLVSSISNGIRDTAYNYLMNVLNNNKNVTVEWSQIEGTTSDYSIYYDNIPSDNVKEVCGYKYTECRNGKWSKIKC